MLSGGEAGSQMIWLSSSITIMNRCIVLSMHFRNLNFPSITVALTKNATLFPSPHTPKNKTTLHLLPQTPQIPEINKQQ